MAFPLGREIVSRRVFGFASGAPDEAKSKFRRSIANFRRGFIDVNAKIILVNDTKCLRFGADRIITEGGFRRCFARFRR